MDFFEKFRETIDKHVNSVEWIRSELLEMDSLADPVLGVAAWDDAVVLDFLGGRIVASVDGPYTKRLVSKSALIHAATDVVVKGGRPLFALDALIGCLDDVRFMVSCLRKQALAMRIPLLGGNTLFEEGVEPRCVVAVVGRLLVSEPVTDSGAKSGDVVLLLGEPVWGDMDERILKAQRMFEAWYTLLDSGVKVHAAKDVTKGGFVSTLYEVCRKSGRGFILEGSVPYPFTRNLDNFLVAVSEGDVDLVFRLCSERRCPVVRVGVLE